MSEARLTALEELTAHQARTIDELSEVLAKQDRLLRRLTGRVEQLSVRIEEAQPGPADASRPPHW